MDGAYHVQIKTKRLQYDFTIHQKYTVIRGDSATGKTSLYRLLELSQRGVVQVSCPVQCLPASALGEDWTFWLQPRRDTILFFDDTDDFVLTDAFAAAARSSDNYFVFLHREPMPHIPYSVHGVYEMKTSGSEHFLEPLYQEDPSSTHPSCTVATDSGSGISNLYQDLLSHGAKGEDMLVLAAGTACGCELDRILGARDYLFPTMRLCLSESAERPL